MKPVTLAVMATLAATGASAQTNLGTQAPEATLPFVMTQVAAFDLPWRLAFLPDGRMLVTEKVGPIWLVTQKGEKTPVAHAPPVLAQGQGGMLGVFLSPHYAEDHFVYLTYAEPGDGGSSLALARARLTSGEKRRQPGRPQGDLARRRARQGRPVRRPGRLFARRERSVPDGRRSPADDARPGPQPAARQDPAPHPRRQARARQPDGRQDRRGHGAGDQSTVRHRTGQDRPGRPHLRLPRTEPDAGRNLDAAATARPTAWPSRRTAGCGRPRWARAAAMN